MFKLSADRLSYTIRAAAMQRPDEQVMADLVEILVAHGATFGLNKPLRLAHFLAQVMEESDDLRDCSKAWGLMTGQGTETLEGFQTWLASFHPAVPDFQRDLKTIHVHPWRSMFPLWIWATNNLSLVADNGDLAAVTRAMRGQSRDPDRLISTFIRLALVILGYRADELAEFREDYLKLYPQLEPDERFDLLVLNEELGKLR